MEQIALPDGGTLINARVFGEYYGWYSGKGIPVLMRLEKNGKKTWSKKLVNTGVPGDTLYIEKFTRTVTGDFIIAGKQYSSSNGNNYLFIAKVSSSGSLLWHKEFEITEATSFYGFDICGMTIDNDGSIYLSSVNYRVSTTHHAALFRFDPMGNISWTKKYDFEAFTILTFNAVSGLYINGNELVAVSSMLDKFSQFSGMRDGFVLTKLDKSNGDVLAEKCYALPKYSNGGAVGPINYKSTRLNNGHYVIHGHPYWFDRVHIATIAEFDEQFKLVDARQIIDTDYNDKFGDAFPSIHVNMDGTIMLITDELNNCNKHIAVYDATSKKIIQTQVIKATGIGGFNFGYSIAENISISPLNGSYNIVFELGKNTLVGAGLESINFNIGQQFQNDCFNKQVDTPAMSEPLIPIQLTEEYFHYDIIEPCELVEKNFTLALVDEDITVTDMCYVPSLCDKISIQGPAKVCNIQSPVTYKALKGDACTRRVSWQLDTAAYSKLTYINDTTVSIRFKQSWQGKLYASLDDCDIIDSLDIVVFNTPDKLNIGNDTLLCKGDTLTLTAPQVFKSYAWNTGSTNNQIKVYEDGIYYVDVTDQCGGLQSDSIRITIPPYSFSTPRQVEICEKDTLKLDVPVWLKYCNWEPDYNVVNHIAGNVRFWPDTSVTYIFSARSPGNCPVRDTMRINVTPAPSLHLGNDTTFCKGDSVLLTVPNPQSYSSLLWNNGSTTSSIWVHSPGNYWAKVTASSGCAVSDTIVIPAVFDLPDPRLPKSGFLCENDVRLNPGNNFTSYLWQDGSGNATYTVVQPGTYWVQVTNNNGCTASDTAIINSFEKSPSGFIITDTVKCNYQAIQLSPLPGYKFEKYLWSTGERSPAITVTNPGTYWLEVTNNMGCKAKQDIIVNNKDCIQEIYFPNAFSPNGDGNNDVFKPIVFAKLEFYQLSVYNRWGQRVFYTNEPAHGWDGTFNGYKQLAGTYTWYALYKMEGKEKAIAKGFIELIK